MRADEAASEVAIPSGITGEEAFRFVAGLTDAETRVLVLRQIEAMAEAERSAEGGPSGLAVVLVRFRVWLEGRAMLLRTRTALLDEGVKRLPECIETVLRSLSADGGWGGFGAGVVAILLALSPSCWLCCWAVGAISASFT
jgi:hypothetical protein